MGGVHIFQTLEGELKCFCFYKLIFSTFSLIPYEGYIICKHAGIGYICTTSRVYFILFYLFFILFLGGEGVRGGSMLYMCIIEFIFMGGSYYTKILVGGERMCQFTQKKGRLPKAVRYTISLSTGWCHKSLTSTIFIVYFVDREWTSGERVCPKPWTLIEGGVKGKWLW